MAGAVRLRAIWSSGPAYLAKFAAITAGAIALLMNRTVDAGFTQPFTRLLVVVCAGLINLFHGQAVTSGVVLTFAHAPGGVTVSSGCNALEVSIIFAAAVLAFPSSVLNRVIGAVVGIAAIQALNIGRIVSLLYLARLEPKWFDFFHLYVWDAFIMLDGVLLFIAWRRWDDARDLSSDRSSSVGAASGLS